MEPTLTPLDPADDPLEALLREAPTPIPDNGFTARVCAALPRRRPSVLPAMRWLLLSGALLLGCLLTWLIWSSIDPSLPSTLADAMHGWKLEPWHALLCVIAVSVWAVARNEREDGIVVR